MLPKLWQGGTIMPRVVHFELTADDPVRASEFYTNVFGWQIQKWDGPEDYWLVTTGGRETPGIDGGIMRRADFGGASVINVPGTPHHLLPRMIAGAAVIGTPLGTAGAAPASLLNDGM
jgi:hypothetical protein